MRRILALVLILLLLTGCVPAQTPTGTTAAPAAPEGSLTVHFIDVGQADCALLECGGAYMLIDGGNREDSALVVRYLEQQGVTKLDAVVCTHPHEDHVGGLPAVLAVYETAAVYAPTRTYASEVFDDFLYYADQQGLTVTTPSPGDGFSLGSATVTVLGPVQSYAEPNDTSIILKVAFGGTSFLFTGDMETTAERDMLDHWGDSFDWHADVLKVGHHGSDTSTGYRFLNAVMPAYGIISVGADNSYGHPHELPLSRLRDAGVTVYRTDRLGHILVTSDGTDLTFTWGDQSARPEETAPTVQTRYIGNRNSKKLHAPDCPSLPKEENRAYFDSYQDALDQGYTPCGNCLG